MRTILLAAFMTFITLYASTQSNPPETSDNNLLGDPMGLAELLVFYCERAPLDSVRM